MAFCPGCGTQIQDNAAFCGGCGKPTVVAASAAAPPSQIAAPAAPATVAVPAPAATTGMADNVAGALAYITIVPAILFLMLEPYNKNKFVRFHSFQSIFLAIAWFVFWMVMSFVITPILGFWATHSLMSLIGLAIFVLSIVLLIKAYQGQVFKLPVVGEMAEKQASAV